MSLNRILSIFIVLLFLLVPCASAAITINDDNRVVTITGNTAINFTGLNDWLSSNRDQANATKVLESIGDKQWRMNYELNVPGTTDCFYINDTDAVYVRQGYSVGAAYMYYRAFQGRIEFENTRVDFIYPLTNEPIIHMSTESLDKVESPRSYVYRPINNVTFCDAGLFSVGYSCDAVSRIPQFTSIDGMVFNNITFLNSSHGLGFGRYGGNYISSRVPSGITVTNITTYGINPKWTGGVYNNNARNSYFGNLKHYGPAWGSTIEATGTYAFAGAFYNTTIENVEAYNCSYSGFLVGGNNVTARNIKVVNSRHNCIEYRGSNITMDGVYAENGRNTHNMIVTGAANDGITVYGNVLRNYTSVNPVSTAFIVASSVDGFVAENVMSIGAPIVVTNSWHGKYINITSHNNTKSNDFMGAVFKNSIYSGEGNNSVNYNNTFIDTKRTGSFAAGMQDVFLMQCSDTILINCEFTNPYINNASYVTYHYPNITVVNANGHKIGGATITFNSTSRNGYGDIRESYVTKNNGRIHGADRANCAALQSGYDYTVTATKDGQTAIGIITSDMLRYSADRMVSSSDEVVIVLDAQSTSLDVLSSSPTDSTPTIAAGQSQTFSVTLNKPSSITWYVNAVETEIVSGVLTDTFSYGAGQAAGEYNIVATAVNGTDSLIQTWTLTIEAEPVTPEEPSDRMSGPETAIALIGVLLVVLVATAILGSLAGLITGVIDMQQTAAIVGAMVLVAVLAFVGLAVLSGISGALNL